LVVAAAAALAGGAVWVMQLQWQGGQVTRVLQEANRERQERSSALAKAAEECQGVSRR
jgi:hypothetical protein